MGNAKGNEIRVEIYGAQLEHFKCPACEAAKKLLNENNIPYIFHSVVSDAEKSPYFKYELDAINQLAKRLNVRHRKFVYPQIFIDNRCIGGLNQLKIYLGE